MIREIQLSDIDCILPLIDQMHKIHYQALPEIISSKFDYDQARKQLTVLINQDHLFHFVYEIENKIVAYLELSIKSSTTNLVFPNETTMMIEFLVVDQQFRRRGIAAELVQFAQKKMQKNKSNVLMLDVIPTITPAKTLYQQQGFQTMFEVMYYKG